jgi:hypothetical protein
MVIYVTKVFEKSKVFLKKHPRINFSRMFLYQK